MFIWPGVIVGLEDLKNKRNGLQSVIDREESEKICLEKNIKILQDKLNILSNQLAQHKNLRDNYDKTIRDTQNGFRKVGFCILLVYKQFLLMISIDFRKCSDTAEFSTTWSKFFRKSSC